MITKIILSVLLLGAGWLLRDPWWLTALVWGGGISAVWFPVGRHLVQTAAITAMAAAGLLFVSQQATALRWFWPLLSAGIVLTWAGAWAGLTQDGKKYEKV